MKSPGESEGCSKSNARCPTQKVVANSLAATSFEPEDPSDQVPVADDQSSIIPLDRSLQLQADDSTRLGKLYPEQDSPKWLTRGLTIWGTLGYPHCNFNILDMSKIILHQMSGRYLMSPLTVQSIGDFVKSL